MKNIKIWNICVVAVVWNNPPNNPIPLAKELVNKLANAIKKRTNKIIKTIRLKSIDLSRLSVTELDNNNNNIE